MIFTKKFLNELYQKIKGSDSYPMTKKKVQILTNMRLMETDKKFIFSSLIDDISRYKDPASLSIFWNEQINDQNLKFKF